MSVAFASARPRGKGEVTQQTIQKMLDENHHLIQCIPGQRPLPGPRRGRGTSWVRVSLSHSGKSECASREPSLPVSLADPASSQSYVLLLKSPEGARLRARCGPVAAASRRPARGRPHRSEEACPPALLCL
uniref:SS18L1 subunit of BAF chromatin remodeling complex n=1 Tax=Rousettus aegyptiacus TaxID=9407 RepID=A0A7J8DM09_ROUAE|nr:SS18L1 subunit of BAF chromatin remodeling complex [Rousettus aegyptiacus]